MPFIKVILNLILITFTLLQGSQHACAQTPSREYQLKAVFLFNFTQFVDWPANAFENDRSPIIIGIIGENPFGTYLAQTIADEKLGNHPMEVQHYKNEEEIRSCHVFFINIRDTKKQEQILRTLQGRHILTVSDQPDFLKLGGMIKFVTNNNKIKLQINIDACKESKMVLSSKLLRLAEIIKNPVK